MNYRREIDGLRALAVIPVILFHSGFESFSGGFIGVDVFFVISGYLITTIIVTDIELGKFSVLNFYERRARRILPALFVVLLTCIPFYWFWLTPADLKSFSQSLVAVPLFASNILFYLTSGYFQSEAELKPLLHTWSLAVEEQYYLLFPIFLVATWRLGKLWIFSLLGMLAILSLGLAQWGSNTHPAFTFFLLPTRGWEILLGAFAAFYLTIKKSRDISQSVSQSVSFIGIILILYAVVFFNKETPFPSLYTLVPTIGAALIILFTTQSTFVGKFLGSKLLVGIGLLSYSAYLWHQPIFAFVRLRSFEDPSKLFFAGLVVLAFLLAYLTWKYVEVPFRNRRLIKRNLLVVLSISFSGLFVTLGLLGHFKDGFPTPQQKQINAYANYDYMKAYRGGKCFLEETSTSYTDFSRDCAVIDNHNPSLLVFGDSHAAALSKGLRMEIPNVIQYTTSSCPPIAFTNFKRSGCERINLFVLQEIKRIKPNRVWLHANWYAYDSDKLKNISKTIEFIHMNSPSTEISIIGSVPHWKPSLPVIMLKKDITLDGEYYVESSMYSDLKLLDVNLEKICNSNQTDFKSVLEILCVDGKCQVTTHLNNVIGLTAWDSEHLTEFGSILLARKLLNK
jgi:peptidoglycan/LPS O-acetylase OafA/YrhL